ncbi:hypothetical protein FRX31_003240 [Thalictrum thalictroides]|uniref:Uncharacterized protein n=1 Tax=Thalictrum thalictroides TaxID=46969 RepID=A0A7J6XDT8_THATH|nr:hypothetical protein FRX31_003240 [Thalictrum thalictroides]
MEECRSSNCYCGKAETSCRNLLKVQLAQFSHPIRSSPASQWNALTPLNLHPQHFDVLYLTSTFKVNNYTSVLKK